MEEEGNQNKSITEKEVENFVKLILYLQSCEDEDDPKNYEGMIDSKGDWVKY